MRVLSSQMIAIELPNHTMQQHATRTPKPSRVLPPLCAMRWVLRLGAPLRKFACYVGERHTRHKRPELGTHGMRGSKPAGFSGVGERAARSLDRVSRRRGPRGKFTIRAC